MPGTLNESIAPKNPNYSNTTFPNALDDAKEYGLMQDIDSEMLQQYKRYESQIAAGNFDVAFQIAYSTIPGSSKKLADALFDAKKYNWLRDSVLSMQDFFLNSFQKYIDEKTKEAVGLSNNEKDPNWDLKAYTIAKTNQLLFEKFPIYLDVNKWEQHDDLWLQGNHNYNMFYMDADWIRYPMLDKRWDVETGKFVDNPLNGTETKAYMKAYSFLGRGETNSSNEIYIYAYKRPAISFSVYLKRI